jgi:hypothetical protein
VKLIISFCRSLVYVDRTLVANTGYERGSQPFLRPVFMGWSMDTLLLCRCIDCRKLTSWMPLAALLALRILMTMLLIANSDCATSPLNVTCVVIVRKMHRNNVLNTGMHNGWVLRPIRKSSVNFNLASSSYKCTLEFSRLLSDQCLGCSKTRQRIVN